MSGYQFSVDGESTFLNGHAFLARGLRCSNALYSEESADELIANLDLYTRFGVNTISVFLMGNRFSDFSGYLEDASLDPVYSARMEEIIEAADTRGMVVIVGCLYWGETKAKFTTWTQDDANAAIRNTAAWISENDFRNVFLDVDNEGMARAAAGFDNREMVLAAKSAHPGVIVATNHHGIPPAEADLALHHSDVAVGKPYIESEGSPLWAPGAYWGRWSRKFDPVNQYQRDPNYWNYINVGVYTEEMKRDVISTAKSHFDRGWGYLFASTWLQAVPPLGPNYRPGGDGSLAHPGIRWWFEFLQSEFGAYRPE